MGQVPEQPTSPFLDLPASAHLHRNDLAFAIRDRFPVSPGHTLVVPFRLVPQWWDATPAEQAAILELVDRVRAELLDDHLRASALPGVPRPDGFNVGFNAGAAAGQTVEHLHMHVIPRYRGDMADPRGGIRHAIPAKGNYLASPIEAAFRAAMELHDSPARPLGPALADLLEHPETARADLMRIGSEIREALEAPAMMDDDTMPWTAQASSAPVETGSKRILGAVYVSCAGRGGPHFGGPSAEMHIVRRALGDVPLVGFFAGGEIAHRHLHGYTGVLTVFTSP